MSYPAPPPSQPASTPPSNNLVWAILSTIFCCLPLGIVSIVYAAQVNGKWASGDVAGAQESSRKAKQFALWGTIIGLIVNIVVIAIYAVALSTADTSSSGF